MHDRACSGQQHVSRVRHRSDRRISQAQNSGRARERWTWVEQFPGYAQALKTTANLQKVGTLDAMSLLPEDVLEMCYRGGAAAMRLGDQIGRLAPGALADIVLVDLERAHIAPVHSPQSALVYNANGNDVDTVIANGTVVVRGGELVGLSEKSLARDCQRAAEAMVRRAGIRK